MELAKIEIDDHGTGFVAEHNMPCAVCGENKAVLDMNHGVFQPCWSCQRDGFRLVRRRRYRTIR